MFVTDYSKWLTNIRNTSAMYVNAYKTYQTHDVDDWEGKAWHILQQPIEKRLSGLLLTGSNGTGKHTALASFLVAMSEMNYDVFIFDRKAMPRTKEEYSKFEELFDKMLDECIESGKSCSVVFEDIEKYEYTDDLLSLMVYYACIYKKFADNYPPLFFILISNDSLPVPSLLNKYVGSYNFSTTTYEQRIKFLNKNFKDLSEDIEFDYLASKVGDCHYGLLNQISENLLLIKASSFVKGVSSNDVDRVIDLYRGSNEEVDNIGRIADQLERFVQLLPDVIANTNAGNGYIKEAHINSANTPQPMLDGSNMDVKRKEYFEMPPKKLALELMSEDALQSILDAAEVYKAELTN